MCGFGPAIVGDEAQGPDCIGVDANAGGLATVALECLPTERAVDPLFRRAPDASASGGWSPWEMVEPAACVANVDIAAAVAQEFQRLPLTPSSLSVQPPSGWTLVNADTVVYTDDAEQTLATTVLGIGVSIRATPARFTWDFGDGVGSLTTTDPGRPWPEHTLAHRYSAEGTHRITLTTTWTAVFQVAGTTSWEPVVGTATTTSASDPLTVYEARSRLVDGPTT